MLQSPSAIRENPWPPCGSDQIKVMILGVYHMDNPGLDEVNVQADDVLAQQRQEELQSLIERFIEWEPDLIALEYPYDNEDELNALYQAYRSGERRYDQADSDDSNDSNTNESEVSSRNEVIQIGFRLAEYLDHERVAPVDEKPPQPETDPFADRDIESTRKTDISVLASETYQQKVDKRLQESTIPEYLAWLNSEVNLRFNHDKMFDVGIRTTDDQFGTPTAIAYWYDRNIRMVHHLWRAVETDTERVFFPVGSGHVRILRHLLDEAPMFCPLSPTEYLPDLE
ncbi:MAG: DUF5694 domain-containing protein [Halobacteriaceae archaeon]